jgi:hypothetical protein
MQRQDKNVPAKIVLAALCQLALLSAAPGCGSDDSDPEGGSDDADETADDDSDPDGTDGDADGEAVYAIGTSVYGDTTSSSYVRVVTSLDLKGAEVKLDEAREFAGNSDLSAYQGDLLIADGEKPEIARFEVMDDFALSQVPPPVNFGSYGIQSAAFWNNQFVADDKAYIVNGAVELIVWSPQSMEVTGTIELPELAPRDALSAVPGLADRSSVVHDGKFYLPLYWTDESYADRTDDSVIVVVDVASDTVEGMIVANCPGLDYGTVDDEGKLHFSNWTGGPGVHYVLGTAQTCIATLDPATGEVTTKTFASITGGHEGAAFKYAGGGRFVMSVFDEVRADAMNAEDPWAIVGELNWQLWSYDPTSGEAAPITGVDWNSGAIIHSRIGDDVYSLVPGESYKSTVAYKLDGEGGAERAFSITGWSYRLFQVR